MNNNLVNLGQRRFPPVYRPNQQLQDQQSLYPMGQFLGAPFPVEPDAVSQYDPAASKKVFGMPEDRFTSLLGTLAHAIAPGSFGGNLGAGVVNMSNLLRNERLLQGRQKSAAAAAKQRSAAETLKAQTKKKETVPTVKHFQVGERSVPHSFKPDTGKWEPIPGMEGKEVKGPAKEKAKPPTIRTFRVGDRDVQHAWEPTSGQWTPVAGMPGKKVKPPAGEKSKEMTFSEKRQRAKGKRELEISILDPKNLENPALQVNVEAFNEAGDKPYVYHRTPGTPEQVVDWGRDIPAVPTTIEKVNVSTPEKIRDSDLPVEMKLNLLRTRFGYD